MNRLMWKPSAEVLAALTAEDVCRMALSAYYAAARGEPLELETFEPGDDVMPGEEFCSTIEGHFLARLAIHERRVGFGPRTSSMNIARLIERLDPDFYGPEVNRLPSVENGSKNVPQSGVRGG